MTHPVQWRGFRLWEKVLLLVLPLLALGALASRFIDEAYLRRLARVAGARPLILWLVSDNNALFVAGGLLLLAAGLLLWRRHRLNNDKRLWVSSGCPYCQDRDLVRVKRKGQDRFYGYLGIPAYRYACRNCNWRGLRIGRHEYSPEREKELEEAWRRFEPDGVPALASPETANGSPQGAATQEPPAE
jgi:LPXTG-motif cell wall-anchored protein